VKSKNLREAFCLWLASAIGTADVELSHSGHRSMGSALGFFGMFALVLLRDWIVEGGKKQ